MTTFESESGAQIELPRTWSDLAELLKSDDLSEKEKINLQLAWYMQARLTPLEYEKQMKAEDNGESTNG